MRGPIIVGLYYVHMYKLLVPISPSSATFSSGSYMLRRLDPWVYEDPNTYLEFYTCPKLSLDYLAGKGRRKVGPRNTYDPFPRISPNGAYIR